ncbi:alpha-hydroxy-acid oxidizing protein [Verticiella sediminum]|uniref:Alpha-hydroxy-acid oxidizing protein n=1 Tax=Verticiella sediminum TaxID=1247510 RepID=A0A556AD45_9BURK|nr:alpha-hydroxy acid oxidase [Verticiella sediminum]TSH90811.1 alpha-hydroxy-acid oxidizing protein [Verticiella sediminum]
MTSAPARRPRRVGDCHSIADLRSLAQRRLPRAVFDFYDGGAEDERTLAANRSAFASHRFAPHVLMDVAQVSTACELVGGPAGMPAAIAPTGAAGFGWRTADLALAKAAAEHGIPYTLSSSATTAIETIAREAPGRHWFQAYVLRDQVFFWKLIERALAADYEALVITVDLPVGGKRERDFHNHFSIPFRFSARNVMDFASRPAWALDMLFKGMPVMENLRGLETTAKSATAIASSVGRSYDPSFDHHRLARVRDRWPRKLIVKGLSRGDDVERLVAMGVDAIVVSNHGGRQLDGAVATLDALPEVVQAAAGRVPVLVDGGVRRGSDIAMALALGAQGVLLGRATLFGAVAAGEPGARRALAILHDELQRTQRLCGVGNVTDFTDDILRKPPAWSFHKKQKPPLSVWRQHHDLSNT